MDKYFISCDWGTTSFRLRLAETQTCRILQEVSCSQGIAATYRLYSQGLEVKCTATEDRFLFYLQLIKDQLTILEKQVNFALTGIPVVISGMASSSIGMLELPYAALPFPLDGSGAITQWIPSAANFPHDVLLISGLKSNKDVMRGEETQIIGLTTQLATDQAICIFPGTHSKHIYTDGQYITGFRTYMTGELFETISVHTILKASLDNPQTKEADTHLMKAFELGVQATLDLDNILHALFTVRTGELFGERSKQENYYYLSGLLIGKELTDLLNFPSKQVYICSSSHLVKFYQAAAEALQLTNRTNTIPAGIIDEVAVGGQWRIWQHKA
jgi:2-dehydro-3-deoxygalactonokinase